MTPRVVILSAPSGGGKSAIIRELLQRHPDRFGYSVSATTRKPRPGEQDGVAYHFLTRREFERRRAAGEFLESAEYAGELYGTLKAEVDRVLARGLHVLLDIEVNGTRQVRATYPKPASISIFLVPPSTTVLLERLRGRRTESAPELARRVQIAVDEIGTAIDGVQTGVLYDHVVVNEDLEHTVGRIAEIVERPAREAQRTSQMISLLQGLVGDLDRTALQLQESLKEPR